MCQGDIWESVPIIVPAVDATSGELRVSFPLLSLAQQDQNRQQLLRREEVAPAEAMFVGEVPGIGEAFCLLSETYWLPARLFDPEFASYAGHPDAEEDARYLTARNGGARLGRLEDERVRLLHQKMRAFWTRFIEGRPPNP